MFRIRAPSVYKFLLHKGTFVLQFQCLQRLVGSQYRIMKHKVTEVLKRPQNTRLNAQEGECPCGTQRVGVSNDLDKNYNLMTPNRVIMT